MISGNTSHKLDRIKTYNGSEPYVIGVNGVTKIDYDGSGNPIKVYYTIDEINYETELTTINRFLDNNKPLVNINRGSKIEPETSFTTNIPSSSDFFSSDENFFREEAKIGLVFPIKTEEEIFIERQYQSVLEQHSRMGEINSLDGLIRYRNGYYRVKSDF